MRLSALCALAVLAASAAVTPDARARGGDETDVAPPDPNETLIYVIREKRFSGGMVTFWVALNDQTVARVDDKRYAVIRAKTGFNTVNLAARGMVFAATAVDDRPGDTVYLTYEVGDENFKEIDAAEARGFLKKYKRMDPLDEPRANNEEMRVLMNPARLGFDLKQRSKPGMQPTNDSAVVTFFRGSEKVEADLGVWSEQGYLATLGNEEAVEVRVPAGEHVFGAALNSVSVATATLEPGKRYYAQVDVGRTVGSVKLRPVSRGEERGLKKSLKGVEYVEVNEAAATAGFRAREQKVMSFLSMVPEKVRAGEVEAVSISAKNAFE